MSASHPHIDIGVAPQVAQIAPRHRVEPLPQQRFGDLVAASAAAAGAAVDLAQTMMTPTPFFCTIGCDACADRRSGSRCCASAARSALLRSFALARQLRRLLLADLEHASGNPWRRCGCFRASAMRRPPRRLAGLRRQRKDHLHDVVDRLLLAGRSPPCRRGGREPAAGSSRRRRGSARDSSPAFSCATALPSSGGSWSGRTQPISPPTAAVADCENCRATAENRAPCRICWVRRSASCCTSSSCAGLSTARKISATRLCGSLACSLSAFHRLVDLLVGDLDGLRGLAAHQLCPDDRGGELIDQRAAVDAARLAGTRSAAPICMLFCFSICCSAALISLSVAVTFWRLASCNCSFSSISERSTCVPIRWRVSGVSRNVGRQHDHPHARARGRRPRSRRR